MTISELRSGLNTGAHSGLRGDIVSPKRTMDFFAGYVLLGVIARGGMGTVYHAVQRSLHREVALKMISQQGVLSPSAVARFRTEAEAMAKLDHPFIVSIHEIGCFEGQPYLSMRLVDGSNLAESIAEKPLDVTSAVSLVQKVARTLHYAHLQGVLHRDIKPNNILVDAQGEPHITDFGIAQILDRDPLSLVRGTMGTPGYMAPEQVRNDGKPITAAADVYGLGAVLYWLLTGYVPFRGADCPTILSTIVHTRPTRPSLYNPAVDKNLESICLKCLEKEREERYGSAKELEQDLEKWLRGQPVAARRETLAEKTARAVRKVKGWVRSFPRSPARLGMAMVTAAFAISSFYVGGVVKLATMEERAAVPVKSPKQTQARSGSNTSGDSASRKLDPVLQERLKQQWVQVKNLLSFLSPEAASETIRRYLEFQEDVPTMLPFRIGPDGSLISAPTMRVFLLDYWWKVDPKSAGEYLPIIWSESKSAEEWAVTLRNYGRANPAPESQNYLRGKLLEMLQTESWQDNPSDGYWEAFKMAVSLRDTSFVPVLAQLMQKPKTFDQALHALELWVFVDLEVAAEVFDWDFDLFEGPTMARVRLFSRADVRDFRQREALEKYLLNPAVQSDELQEFAGIYPNTHFYGVCNSGTQGSAFSESEVASREDMALQYVRDWQHDERFSKLHPFLIEIQQRLEAAGEFPPEAAGLGDE